MSGVIAIFGSLLAFAIPLVLALAAQDWRRYGITIALGVVVFGWLTWDLAQPAPLSEAFPGRGIAGLMLFGFAAGAIARFVMLLSRRER